MANMFKKVIASTIVLSGLSLASATSAFASEGTFELKNTVGEQARCFAFSVLMPSQKYEVLMSCRDILYPGGTQVFDYVVWAQDADGKTENLGTLDKGKIQFSVAKQFASLFVTKETSEKARNPEGTVIMRGYWKDIDILKANAQTTTQPGETPEAELTPAPEEVKKGSPLNIFRIGGAIAILFLAATMLVVYFITKR